MAQMRHALSLSPRGVMTQCDVLGAAHMSEKVDPDLRVQALRLPQSGRADLDAFVRELNDSRTSRCSAAEVTRGLVLLALHCGRGIAGRRLAEAFRLAAIDPTEQ